MDKQFFETHSNLGDDEIIIAWDLAFDSFHDDFDFLLKAWKFPENEQWTIVAPGDQENFLEKLSPIDREDLLEEFFSKKEQEGDEIKLERVLSKSDRN